MGKKKFDWEEKDEVLEVEVFDTNSIQLFSGDSVIAIKDIKVKGASDIKRGDKFKNIRLTEDPELIES
jgi:protein PhnA